MSIINFPPFTVHSENVEQVCSEYHFDAKHNSWEEAEQYCKGRNYDGLVSMQAEGEWFYFKNITTIITQEQKRARWFIGLRYFSHKWCWSSDTKACKNQTTDDTGNWRWEFAVESQTTFMLSIVLRCARAEDTITSIAEENLST